MKLSKMLSGRNDPMRIMKRSAVRRILLAVILCCLIGSAGADTWYAENEWNYLDEAMEPDKGIPEDAEGVLARIERNGVLRVAADFDCAPLNFLEQSFQVRPLSSLYCHCRVYIS